MKMTTLALAAALASPAIVFAAPANYADGIGEPVDSPCHLQGAAEASLLRLQDDASRRRVHRARSRLAAGEADIELYRADLKGPLAIVMGAEGEGMRRLTRETCDQLVRLPMAGHVGSLNVSVAAGVCLYEAVRQRNTL